MPGMGALQGRALSCSSLRDEVCQVINEKRHSRGNSMGRDLGGGERGRERERIGHLGDC